MLKIMRHGYSNFFRSPFNFFLDENFVIPLNNQLFSEAPPQHRNQRHMSTEPSSQGNHFVCLKDWDQQKVMNLLYSAMQLKLQCQDTHGQKLNTHKAAKVMILDDHNEPFLHVAASKACSLLGADEVHIRDEIDWSHDYYSRVFSEMADVIFVSTQTHGCMRKFCEYSLVPVVVMRSRRHASIQSLATVMSIFEDYGRMNCQNLAYVGAPHQVINDYLLLCPMLGANFKFKCSCKTCPVSPLMLHESKCICEKTNTTINQSTETSETLRDASIIIAGPTTTHKEKIPEFILTTDHIQKATSCCWTFYHTIPRGPEVDDSLFWHKNARTFNAFKNTQYIIAALINLAMCQRKC